MKVRRFYIIIYLTDWYREYCVTNNVDCNFSELKYINNCYFLHQNSRIIILPGIFYFWRIQVTKCYGQEFTKEFPRSFNLRGHLIPPALHSSCYITLVYRTRLLFRLNTAGFRKLRLFIWYLKLIPLICNKLMMYM